jgi:DNA primase
LSNDIKNHLLHNKKDLVLLLKEYGYGKFNVNEDEIRCSKPDSSNGSTCRIRLNNSLMCTDFSSSFNGDIFELIIFHTDTTYADIIGKCYEMFNIENIDDDDFDGLDLDLGLDTKPKEVLIPIYDKSELDNYEHVWNMKFVEDNIMPRTQEIFGIGYDYRSRRITIPWFTVEGELLGVMGRAYYTGYGNFKYVPLLRFKKHHSLYGIYENKKYIENNRVYIGESEKFVLQLHTMNVRNALALGGNSIDSYRLSLLEKLNVREIVFCFDEGLDIETQKRALKTAKKYFKNKVKIGVMYDSHNKYLGKGSKCSPTDLGKDVWNNMVNHCIRWMK